MASASSREQMSSLIPTSSSGCRGHRFIPHEHADAIAGHHVIFQPNPRKADLAAKRPQEVSEFPRSRCRFVGAGLHDGDLGARSRGNDFRALYLQTAFFSEVLDLLSYSCA